MGPLREADDRFCFSLSRKIGEGGQGGVYEACVHQSASESDLDPKHIIEAGKEGWKVAVKIIPLDCVEDKYRGTLMTEAKILRDVEHPYVVNCLHAFKIPKGPVWIVMELANAEHHSLHEMSYRNGLTIPLQEDMAWRALIQCALALRFIHSMKIMHRDIKPRNILVFEGSTSPTFKLGDFGCAKEGSIAKTLQIGTNRYLAPEQRFTSLWSRITSKSLAGYDSKVDVYQLGVAIAEACGERRFEVREDLNSLRRRYSPELCDTLSGCLRKKAHQRLSADQLIQLPAVAAVRDRLRIGMIREEGCSVMPDAMHTPR